MKRTLIYVAVLAALLPAMATVAYAADQDRLQTQDQIQDKQIYGSQLMTQQERNQYRARMQAAKTEQEREKIRQQHHEEMQVRARERGVTLPAEPPPHGMGGGMGPGYGGGPGGMGPGGMGGGPDRY